MSNEIQEILVNLAEQLNTTVPYLWDIMILRMRIYSVLELVFNGLFLHFLYKIMKVNYDINSDDDIKSVASILGWVIFAIWLIVYIVSIPNMVSNVIFPEITVLEDIFNLIK